MKKKYRIKSIIDNGYHDGYGKFVGVLYAESYSSESEALIAMVLIEIPKFGVIIEPFYTK